MRNKMSKHLLFNQVPFDGKTKKVCVTSSHDFSVLGYIGWHGGWRQYVFHPNIDCLWSWDCLKDLSEYIKNLMDERRHRQ